MSPITLLRKLLEVPVDPCDNSPSLTSATATNWELNNCFQGGTSGWQVQGSTNYGSALPAGLEYYIEIARDAGGSSFDFWGREYGPTWFEYDPVIGADGEGASTTRYVTWRVWIAPEGKGTGEACDGPVTSNTVSRTANACAAQESKMATTWSRKFRSYYVEIGPETGEAHRVSVTATVVIDGGVKVVTVPDEGSYERDDLGPVALAKLDDFTNDVKAKWAADHELPEA